VRAPLAGDKRRAPEKRQWTTLDCSFAGGHSASEIARQAAFRFFMARVLRSRMRYHKAAPICKVEADFIADTSLSSRNENVVICHGEQWYDVRGMTEKELDDFLADLLRARLDELRAGVVVPH
jgi:hypothetical protein